MSIILSFKKIISMFIAIFMLILGIGPSATFHDVKDADSVKLTFSVLSDCHIESNNFETIKMFNRILNDVKKTENGSDALVFLGDNTMNGQEIENMVFFGLLDAIKPADKVVVAPGNHDFSNGEGDYTEHFNRFADYNKIFCDRDIDTPYYYDILEGCYFIVLSTESASVNQMDISAEQITWLEAVLAEAKASGSPAFVLNHYPITHMDYSSNAALVSALQAYDKLIYFCGHTHTEYGPFSVYEYEGISCINLPKATEHGYEWYDGGIGAQVEVYDGEIIVRIRDFYDNVWHEEFVYEY